MSPRTWLSKASDVATIVIALAALAVLVKKFWANDGPEDPAKLTRRLSTEEIRDARSLGRLIGPADSKVELVVYSDYQCPFCREADRTLREVQQQYPTEVSIRVRHMPLSSIHPRAVLAASAADCAGEQGKFIEMHSALFDHQYQLPGSNSAWFVARADSVAIPDRSAFSACLGSEASIARVSADSASGWRLRLQGTPAILLGDQLILGSPDPTGLKAAVARLIERSSQ